MADERGEKVMPVGQRKEVKRMSSAGEINEMRRVASNLGMEANYIALLDKLTFRDRGGKVIMALGFVAEQENSYPGDPVESFEAPKVEGGLPSYTWDRKYDKMWPSDMGTTVASLSNAGLAVVPLLEIPSVAKSTISGLGGNELATTGELRGWRQGVAIMPEKGGADALVLWFEQRLAGEGPAKLVPVKWQLIRSDWIKDDSKQIDPNKTGGYGYLKPKV